MVEYVAHNGRVVGSNPATLKEKGVKSYCKSICLLLALAGIPTYFLNLDVAIRDAAVNSTDPQRANMHKS